MSEFSPNPVYSQNSEFYGVQFRESDIVPTVSSYTPGPALTKLFGSFGMNAKEPTLS